MSNKRLVLATHGPIVLVDGDWSLSESEAFFSPSDWASPATVDRAGNIYSVALSGVYSFDPLGKTRWVFRTVNATGAEFVQFYPPGLSPDGLLYAVCADGFLRAIRSQDGAEIWRQSVEVTAVPSQVMGGAGDAVFVLNGSAGVQAYDRRTGQRLGEFRDERQSGLFSTKGMWALGWDFGIQFGTIYSFDTCGKVKWSTLLESRYNDWSGIISLPEALVATKWDVDGSGARISSDRLYRYGPNGAVLQGPVPGRGQPYVAGADGTVYAVNCADASPRANEIVAYSDSSEELWSLDLGVSEGCPVGSAVLSEDGVLYLMRGLSVGGGVEVLAIQTQSPGLAESSWPSLRHDNQGTMWLTSLP